MVRHGFTLIELLVVIGIIVLLIAILVPSYEIAVAAAQNSKCQANLKGVGTAFQTFASEHEGTLPGVGRGYDAATAPKEWQWSWMGNETWLATVPPGEVPFNNRNFDSTGMNNNIPGTLLKYIGSVETARKLYRDPGLGEGLRGSGKGSNGMFDIASIAFFSGAKLDRIGASSTVRNPATGEWTSAPTPLIVDEDPSSSINNNTGAYAYPNSMDPAHTELDRLSTAHPDNGGNYFAVTGGVEQINSAKPGEGPTPKNDWKTQSPTRKEQKHLSAGTDPNTTPTFGAWNKE